MPNRTLTTQQVAEGLGLRPATVQLYARDGKIPFDRTPGGHRRYDLGEVRAALGQPDNAEADAAPIRTALNNWLCDATDLEQWAGRLVARSKLPWLVRSLVTTSTDQLQRADFRTDEGTGLSGYDGIVVSESGSAWVPVGQSAWEMGVGDPQAKANKDYRTRTNDPLELKLEETTFVFVTPRRWDEKESWASKKRGEGKWKDVRALDADDLHAWMEQSPSVHAQMTRLLGREPVGVTSVDQAWSKWTRNSGSFPEKLLLVDRGKQQSAVQELLEAQPAELYVQGETSDEGFAFLLSVLRDLPADVRENVHARTLIVETGEAWNELLERANTASPMVLIPTFDAPQTFEAVDAGHFVLLPIGNDVSVSASPVELPRQKRQSLCDAFKEAGYKHEEAWRLSKVSRRSLKAVRRRLSLDPVVVKPEWSEQPYAKDIAVAVLLGTWADNSEGDRKLVEAISRSTYDDFTERLGRWLDIPDAPVGRSGHTWFAVSKEDAWSLVGNKLPTKVLVGFVDELVAVLQEKDPALELDSDKRWAASLYGKQQKQSAKLVAGLVDSLALIAARSEETRLQGVRSGQQLADAVVRRVLEHANADEDGVLWCSLSNHLPSLAEASPGVFLECVDEGLSGAMPLAKTFDPNNENALFGRAHHTGLLWGLEGLAWTEEFLPEVTSLLLRLGEVDPGAENSRYMNRPGESLRCIYLPWRPHTRVGISERLEILDAAQQQQDGDALWRLLTALLPKHHDHASRTHVPAWRDWAPEFEDGGSYLRSEYLQQVNAVADWAIAHVGTSGKRWRDLIEQLGRLPIEKHRAVVGQLRQAWVDIDEEDRTLVIKALRKCVAHHSEFPDADWSMPSEMVDELDKLLGELGAQRTKTAMDWAWMFSWDPDLPHMPRDFNERDAFIQESQSAAVNEILQELGWQGIIEVAEMADNPHMVGYALAASDAAPAELLLDLFTSDVDALLQVATGYARGCFKRESWAWLDTQLSKASEWPEQKTARLLLAFWAEKETFERVAASSDVVQKAYWSEFKPWGLGPDVDIDFVARKLFESGQANSALDALGLYSEKFVSDPPLATDVELIVDVMEAATGESLNPTTFAHSVGRLLDVLDVRGVEHTRIAQMEWKYLGLLDWEREPKFLSELISSDTDFFVHLIELIYRPDDEDEDDQEEVTPEQAAMARQASELLSKWHTVPGSADGEADKDALIAWVSNARASLGKLGLLRVGDNWIGRVFAHSVPLNKESKRVLSDAVCEVVQSTASQNIDRGIELELYNRRGVWSRGIYEGGDQERKLAEWFRGLSKECRPRWMRMSAIFRRVAEQYESEARDQDRDADLDQDLD